MSTQVTEQRVRPLPTESDATEIADALQHAFDLLERVNWSVKAVDEVHDYPDPITFEKMGILADIRTFLDCRIDAFQEISKVIDGTMFSLSTIRFEQQAV